MFRIQTHERTVDELLNAFPTLHLYSGKPTTRIRQMHPAPPLNQSANPERQPLPEGTLLFWEQLPPANPWRIWLQHQTQPLILILPHPIPQEYINAIQQAPTTHTLIGSQQPIRILLPDLLNFFFSEEPVRKGISPLAWISPKAHVHPSATIGPFCVIEEGARIAAGVQLVAQIYVGPDVHIGEHTIIFPHVTIYSGVRIGRNCRIHAGCVLGADGFGYLPHNHTLRKIPQRGTVIIEDDVELGAGTMIDRATFHETRIGQGTKIDNLVQVGHNTTIGNHTVIAGQTGIAGSVHIGNYCQIGGQVGIADHVFIGDHVRIGAQAGVNRSLPQPGTYLGAPVLPYRDAVLMLTLMRRLPDLFRQLRTLQAEINTLKKQLAKTQKKP